MSTHSSKAQPAVADSLFPHHKGSAPPEPALTHFAPSSDHQKPPSPGPHHGDAGHDGKTDHALVPQGAHEPHVPKDNKGKFEYYKNAIEKSGGKFDARPGQRNIIGLRGFQDGKLNKNERDKYNDTIAVMWVDDKGNPHFEEYVGSVDPGKTTTKNPAGMPHLMDGQYDYDMGKHHGETTGTHDALVDKRSHVWRDKNNNGERDAGDKEQTGDFGINIHAGGRGESVGRNSKGCQVIKGGWEGKQWKSFMQSMKDDPDGKFKYTLIDGSRLADFEENKLGDDVKAPDGPSKGVDPGAIGQKLRETTLDGIQAAWDGVKAGWNAVKGASNSLAHTLLGDAAGHRGAASGAHAGEAKHGHEDPHHGKESEKESESAEHHGEQKSSHVTADELRKIVPGIPSKRLLRMLGPLNQAIELSGCTTEERKAMFIAQLAHESGGFKFMHELGATPYFDKYEPGTKKGKELGNTEPGDGARYKGRGFIQITGRSNYEKAGKALGIDLVNHPEKAEDPEVAAKVAAWYWRTHTVAKGKGANKKRYHLNDLADKGDFVGVTRGVNGGTNGLKDREAYYARAKAEFHEHPEEPQQEQHAQSESHDKADGLSSLLEGGMDGLGAGLDAMKNVFGHYAG